MNITPPNTIMRPSHIVNATQTSPMHDSLGTQTLPMHDSLGTQTSLNSEHQSHYGVEGDKHQTFTMMGREDTPVKHPEIEPYEEEDEQYIPRLDLTDLILSNFASQSPKHHPGLTPDSSIHYYEEEPVAPDEPGTSQSHRSSKITPEEAVGLSNTFNQRKQEIEEQEIAHLAEQEYRKKLSLKASKDDYNRDRQRQLRSTGDVDELQRHFTRRRKIEEDAAKRLAKEDERLASRMTTRSLTRKESEDKK